MTSCCQQHQMRWSGATGAIARCKRVSTGCGRTRRSVRAWRWICGVKPKPKAGNKPLQHFIVHGLDKPGSFATVSEYAGFIISFCIFVFLVGVTVYAAQKFAPSENHFSIINCVVLFWTMIVLIWYTWETSRLRKEAQKQ